MNYFRSAFFVALAALLIGSAVHAQGLAVRAHVPFDFVVGEKVYPAAEYTIVPAQANLQVAKISAADRETTPSLVLVNSCTVANPPSQTKMVFHRIGNSYFLYQIWTEGNKIGRQFAKSRAEIEMASNQGQVSTVIVAANIVR